MALIQGFGGVVQEVNTKTRAARNSAQPNDVLNYSTVSIKSGLITILAASAPVFALRNAGSNKIAIRRATLQAITAVGFTAAQVVDFQLHIARGYTVFDTLGTLISLGSGNKHKTSHDNLTSLDVRMATTVALTAGTRTLDANPIATVGGWAVAATAGVTIPKTDLIKQDDTNDIPIILAQNEGIVLSPITLMGAAGQVALYLDLEIAEYDEANFPV